MTAPIHASDRHLFFDRWTGLFFNARGEFRLIVLYIPAVAVYGILANLYIPMVEVIWDMVFYKRMAFGLHHFSTFDLKHYFPMPPLYPLILSLGCFAPHYLEIEWIQSWLNPMLYFLTLYPLYRYSRILLNPRESAFICLLFLVYPSSIYTQWSMSENLAAPLVLWTMLYAVKMLIAPCPSLKDGFFLGLAIAALVLTRVQLGVIGVGILIWLTCKTARERKNPAAVLMAGGLSITVLLTVWEWLGYFSTPNSSPLYAEFSSLPMEDALPLCGTILTAHGIGLWLEGGTVIPLFGMTAFLLSLLRPDALTDKQKELARMVFGITLLDLASVAVFYVLRITIEPWSIALRYIFYLNLIGLPMVLDMAGIMRKVPIRPPGLTWILYGLIGCAFALGFVVPGVWSKLSDPHRFFSNAPQLDFMYQLVKEGPVRAGFFFMGISLLLGVLLVYVRYIGRAGWWGALLYIQLCMFDYYFEMHQHTIEVSKIKDIHQFCSRLDAGQWNDIPLYCEDKYDYWVPNIYYWVNRKSVRLPPAAPRPTPPYLLLTDILHPDGELVFQSGELRAYWYRNTGSAPTF